MKLYVPSLPFKTNCALSLTSPIALPPDLSYFCSPPLIVQPVELRHTLIYLLNTVRCSQSIFKLIKWVIFYLYHCPENH